MFLRNTLNGKSTVDAGTAPSVKGQSLWTKDTSREENASKSLYAAVPVYSDSTRLMKIVK